MNKPLPLTRAQEAVKKRLGRLATSLRLSGMNGSRFLPDITIGNGGHQLRRVFLVELPR